MDTIENIAAEIGAITAQAAGATDGARVFGKPFTSDDSRRGPSIQDQPNARGKKKPPLVELPQDGADEQLQAMRHVDVNHKCHDCTERHQSCRKLKEKDLKGFMQLLLNLEDRHSSRELGDSRAISGEERDLGEERARALLAELFRSFRERKK